MEIRRGSREVLEAHQGPPFFGGNMSMATLEREIVFEASRILHNRKLRKKDLREWSTGTVKIAEDEVQIHIPELGVNVVVFKTMDKRKS